MTAAHDESLLAQVAALPALPGVYRYFDAQDQLLYVGKALNLKRRVSSYFQRDHGGTRIGHMVNKIVRMGRPKLANPKRALTVRYDADIVDTFKATGDGWQTRMNDALRDWLKTHSPG